MAPTILESTPGHGLGPGSGSGAGIWLAGSSSPVSKDRGEERKSTNLLEGRKYHISADASKFVDQDKQDLVQLMNPSSSGDVDLDLSFDFVSQLENGRSENITTQTPQKEKDVTTNLSEAGSPKGMSAAKWTSRLKKQPPTALTLSGKKNTKITASLTTPASPLQGKQDEEEVPLAITPLSSTRRAADSGIKTVSSNISLIRQQRLAAQEKQQQQRLSPEKKSPQKKSPQKKSTKKTPLKENFAKNNAQLVQSEEQGDVFDDNTYDYKRHLKKSPSQVSTWTGGKGSSFATAHESNGGKSRRSHRNPPSSMESLNTFDSALSGASSEHDVPTIEVDTVEPMSNMLGLDLNGGAAAAAAASSSSPQQASPDTPFSPVFSDLGVGKGSESMSEGQTTPGTAISTLFEDRSNMSIESKLDSINMTRGGSAPVSSLVEDAIKEEDSNVAQVHSAPSSTFLTDLPPMEDHVADLRHRQATETTMSDGSPTKEKRTMVVSTTSSPTQEVEFLFRRPSVAKTEDNRQTSGARAGPWPQSPLLLNNFPLGDISDELDSTLGLGIDLGQKQHARVPDHMQLDMSELSVERVIVPFQEINELGLDLGLQPMSMSEAKDVPSLALPRGSKEVKKMPSFGSSVEGFSINVTPAGKEDQVKIEFPMDEVVPQSRETNTQSKARWTNKLWSLSPIVSLRSPNRATFENKKTPQMKPLTLVNKDHDWQADHGYNSVPSSAVLPSTSTFAPLQPPAQALSVRARSSRHVSRSSRLPYFPDHNDHVQVDMSSPQVQGAEFALSRDEPSAFTPKMEYLMSAKKRRHSWGYTSTSGVSNTASWLAPPAGHLSAYGGLRNSTLSAVASPVVNDSLAPYSMMDTVIVEDGIRRRANHRATNSVPTTPIMIPEGWASPRLHEPHHRAEEVRFEEAYLKDDAPPRRPRRATQTIMSTLSIFGPASAVVTPYLVGLSGTRNRSKMVRATGSQQQRHLTVTRPHSTIRIFSDDREQIEGLIAISGRALENASPSRSLFFAGFLAMPWLWFIGGWGLENNGSVYIEKDIFWEDGDEEAILFELAERQRVMDGMAVRASSRSLHHTSHRLSTRQPQDRYSMGKPESIINMEEAYQDFQRQGKARSLIENSRHFEGFEPVTYLDQPRRARSVLEGDERNSFRPISMMELQGKNNDAIAVEMMDGQEPGIHSINMQEQDDNDDDSHHETGFAFSSENEKNHFSEVSLHHPTGADFTLPMSHWEDDEDVSNKKKKKKQEKSRLNFFQQVVDANTTMIQKLATASSRRNVKVEQRQYEKQLIKEMKKSSSSSSSPQLKKRTNNQSSALIAAFTNWSNLERFVLWNRIMALLTSIAVFGAFGVAIYFVINDW